MGKLTLWTFINVLVYSVPVFKLSYFSYSRNDCHQSKLNST